MIWQMKTNGEKQLGILHAISMVQQTKIKGFCMSKH